jgi:hypothetical protein
MVAGVVATVAVVDAVVVAVEGMQTIFAPEYP